MKDWTPKPVSEVDLAKLKLSGEEGFVLSRIDGATSVANLSHLTGLPDGRVSEILDRLVKEGAVEPSSAGGRKRAPSRSAAGDMTMEGEPPSHVAAAAADDDDGDTGLTPEELAALEAEMDGLEDDFLGEATVEGEPYEEPTGEEEADAAARGADDEAEDDDDDAPAAEEEAAPDEEEEAEEKEGEEEDAAATANYRKLFMEQYAHLEADARAQIATTASGEVLLAMCFDPNARVIIAVVENVNAGLEHARLIATHHRTATGLDALAKKAAFIRDAQVQRVLMKNPLLPDTLFRRIMAPKRMADVYRLALSRDLTERTKTAARNMFRKKFTEGTPEERVSLLFQTEARCLNLLIGVTIDSRTASLACQRQIHSTLFIQNLARFPSTPPPILIHMYKQPLVKRTPALKNIILRHPNAPSTLKRGQV